jgi:hypothetical protein
MCVFFLAMVVTAPFAIFFGVSEGVVIKDVAIVDGLVGD